MKKQILKRTATVLAAASLMAVGAVGASYMEEIHAYLNYGITVKYDGKEQLMYDANGKRVYPISYNGTTYVPIRAVGNMMGINVAWDGANNAVLLGKTGQAIDFIESFTPYAVEEGYINANAHVKISDGKFLTLGDTTYTHYIKLKSGEYSTSAFYYNIGGKYDTFTFDIYAPKDAYVSIFGDNGTLIDTFSITGSNLPITYSISVSGVQQLSISAKANKKIDYVYILDASIE